MPRASLPRVTYSNIAADFSRLRAPFHLYVPASSVDVAKRLCVDLQISVAEIWAYNSLGDQVRFALVQRSADGKGRATPAPKTAAPAKAKRAAAPSRARASRGAAEKKTSAAGAARTRKTVPGSSKKQKRK